jgi:hypothetical protein
MEEIILSGSESDNPTDDSNDDGEIAVDFRDRSGRFLQGNLVASKGPLTVEHGRTFDNVQIYDHSRRNAKGQPVRAYTEEQIAKKSYSAQGQSPTAIDFQKGREGWD